MVVDGRRDVEAAEALGLLTQISSSVDDIVGALLDKQDKTADALTRSRTEQAVMPRFPA